MSSFLWNHRRRTDINRDITKTMKFKTVFPTVEVFKQALRDKSIPHDNNEDTWFAYLQEMIGNCYLRFTTADKNKGFLAWNWKRYMYIYKKEKELLDKTLDTLNGTQVTNTSKLFRVNRTQQGQLTADFLDSGTEQTQDIKDSLFNKWNTLKEWTKSEDPELTFLGNIATSIVTPIQPESYGEVY